MVGKCAALFCTGCQVQPRCSVPYVCLLICTFLCTCVCFLCDGLVVDTSWARWQPVVSVPWKLVVPEHSLKITTNNNDTWLWNCSASCPLLSLPQFVHHPPGIVYVVAVVSSAASQVLKFHVKQQSTWMKSIRIIDWFAKLVLQTWLTSQ